MKKDYPSQQEPWPMAEKMPPMADLMAIIPYRTQNDGMQRRFAKAARIETGPDTPTRQEFAEESNINNILSRYMGAAIPDPGNGNREVDYNLDLQNAYQAINDAKALDENVPAELRKKYPTWITVLQAVETGQYQYDLQRLELHRKRTEETKKAAELAAKATPEPSPKA